MAALFTVTYGVSTPIAAYGVFLPVFAETFGWSRGAISSALSVNLLLGGEPYEAYIPVQFKLASKNGEATAGTMVTRRAN